MNLEEALKTLEFLLCDDPEDSTEYDKKIKAAVETLVADNKSKDQKIELYENCVADMAGELVKYSHSSYFKKDEATTIDYFKDKWGLSKPNASISK
jgi:hypothetical protein